MSLSPATLLIHPLRGDALQGHRPEPDGPIGPAPARLQAGPLVRSVAKRRADQLLVERGLADSRAKAQALILAGLVSSAGRRIDKPGTALAEETPLAVAGPDHPWVSRGGVKLDFALSHFGVDGTGAIALDIGASTGGLTDVLLARGAARVDAVDVGRGQLRPHRRHLPEP
jgi:23S rRNA (cytidine1920-2'-O)/16S rRNA (cytidine1409-2'-O)-methyltransferase